MEPRASHRLSTCSTTELRIPVCYAFSPWCISKALAVNAANYDSFLEADSSFPVQIAACSLNKFGIAMVLGNDGENIATVSATGV